MSHGTVPDAGACGTSVMSCFWGADTRRAVTEAVSATVNPVHLRGRGDRQREPAQGGISTRFRSPSALQYGYAAVIRIRRRRHRRWQLSNSPKRNPSNTPPSRVLAQQDRRRRASTPPGHQAAIAGRVLSLAVPPPRPDRKSRGGQRVLEIVPDPYAGSADRAGRRRDHELECRLELRR